MATDRTTTTLSELVRRATAIVDADGADDAVTAFAQRHEDDDVPVRGMLDGLEERDFPMRGHILADIEAAGFEREAEGQIRLTLEALTVEDA